MDKADATPEDIKNKVKDIIYTQGRILAELLQTVNQSSLLFGRLNDGIFEPLNGSIEFMYNPMVREDGSSINRKINEKDKH